jgi:hypothetical protein
MSTWKPWLPALAVAAGVFWLIIATGESPKPLMDRVHLGIAAVGALSVERDDSAPIPIAPGPTIDMSSLLPREHKLTSLAAARPAAFSSRDFSNATPNAGGGDAH